MRINRNFKKKFKKKLDVNYYYILKISENNFAFLLKMSDLLLHESVMKSDKPWKLNIPSYGRYPYIREKIHNILMKSIKKTVDTFHFLFFILGSEVYNLRPNVHFHWIFFLECLFQIGDLSLERKYCAPE